jgi:hypothetical protein
MDICANCNIQNNTVQNNKYSSNKRYALPVIFILSMGMPYSINQHTKPNNAKIENTTINHPIEKNYT